MNQRLEGSIPAMLHRHWDKREDRFLLRYIFLVFFKGMFAGGKAGTGNGNMDFNSARLKLHGTVCDITSPLAFMEHKGQRDFCVLGNCGHVPLHSCLLTDSQSTNEIETLHSLACCCLPSYFGYVLQAFFKHSLVIFQIL